MARMDFLRQMEVFAPEKHADKRVDIIGAGAIGSYTAFEVAKVGMENIHLWDFDKVEDHNLPNQHFLMKHVGQNKVDALAEMILEGTGVKSTVHCEAVDGNTELGEIVFMLTDSMAVRKTVFEEAMKFRMRTKCLIECRMGKDSGRVYTLNPVNPAHVKGYESTLYGDEDTEVSACGSSISVAPTAALVASMAVWQMMNHLNGESEIANEILVFTRPWFVQATQFKI